MQKKLIITGGGTAGHVIPCIAVAERLPGWEIHYIGRREGIERELAEKYDILYHGIDCPRFVRNKPWTIFGVPFKLLAAKKQAKKLLEEIKPNVIFSKGGYVSLPVTLAAKNIPVVLHESDMSFGLANRLVLKKCHTVCSSFRMNRPNVICTGSPLKKSVYEGSRSEALSLCGFSGSKPVLLITGGSLGAKPLNDALDKSLDGLIPRFDIIHITGRGKKRTERKGYYPVEFTDRIHSFMAIADYAVSRGGGNTIFELAALGVPTVIVPLPKGASRGDQIENAEYFASKNYAVYIPQDKLEKDGMSAAINTLIKQKQKIQKALAGGSFDGSEEIAKIIRNAAK